MDATFDGVAVGVPSVASIPRLARRCHRQPLAGVLVTYMSVAALLFVGVLLVALGLFVAGNMIIVVTGIVALFGAGVFETLGARRS
jgi:hypothetical protein